MISVLRRLCSSLTDFVRDRKGAVLFYVTATLPALVGFSLLAIDASRLMTLHTSLQKGVDALALAAGGELDRLPGAMQRANLAIEHLVQNSKTFGEGVAAIDENNVTVRFFAALPANDSDPMPGTDLAQGTASNDFIARYVEVKVAPQTFSTIFPASFIGGSDRAVASAVAVAGADEAVCGIAPLWICNPWESSSNTLIRETASIINGSDTRTDRRRQIRMRVGPGGSGYGPGNYGFLDLGNGATALQRALAIGTPENCVVKTGVDFKTGQTTGPVEDGINTRFGIYPNSMASIGITGNPANNWQVRPAKNVRSGQDQSLKANKICKNYEPDPNPANGMALPRDNCFGAGTCTTVGDGSWGQTEVTAYWNANFPSAGGSLPSPGIVAPAIADPVYQTEGAAGSWNQVTRYDIYKYEIASGLINEAAVGGEVGDPADAAGSQCYGGPSLATDTIDRRLITGAILNCNALIASGNNLNGAKKNVPVAAFAQFFITEPLEKGGGSSTAGDIYSELVSVVLPGTHTSYSRDQVQLYR